MARHLIHHAFNFPPWEEAVKLKLRIKASHLNTSPALQLETNTPPISAAGQTTASHCLGTMEVTM